MANILVIMLLALLLFYKGIPAGKGKFHNDIFSVASELPLRGFFMFVVVLHHLSQQLTRPASLRALWDVGMLCVSFFFFLSGYGSAKNYRLDEKYLHHFLRRRFCKLFTPFYLCNLLFLLCNIASGTHYEPFHFIKCLIGMELVNTHAWFILTIAAFDLAFFLSFRFIKRRSRRYLCLAIFWLCYTALCIHRGCGLQLFAGPWWFNSSSLFLAGILASDFENRLLAFLRKYYILSATLGILSFLLFYNMSGYASLAFPYSTGTVNPLSPTALNSWFCLAWQTLATLSFCLMVVLFTMKYKCSNAPLRFLGSCCAELYLIHGLFIQIFKGQFLLLTNDFFFITAVLTCSLLSAWLLQYPTLTIIKTARRLLDGLPF